MNVSTIAWNAEEARERHPGSRSWGHGLGSVRGRHKLSRHDALVQQTQKWVAQTFFGPMLKQMRQSPFHSTLLDGGRGGEAFSQLYDEELTNHMTRGTGSKLINAIVNKIEAKNAYAKQSRTGLNAEREGADRVRAMQRAESNLSVATRSSNVSAAF
jgi:Rod binding domain-containing protein